MNTGAICQICGTYLMPVGDGTNALCGKAADGRCKSDRLIRSPGNLACLNAYLKQMLPVAEYDKSAKQWILQGGQAIVKGVACRTHLDWNKLRARDGSAVAQFGKNRKILAYRLATPA